MTVSLTRNPATAASLTSTITITARRESMSGCWTRCTPRSTARSGTRRARCRRLLREADRLLAEAHHALGLELCGQAAFADALPHFEAARQVERRHAALVARPGRRSRPGRRLGGRGVGVVARGRQPRHGCAGRLSPRRARSRRPQSGRGPRWTNVRGPTSPGSWPRTARPSSTWGAARRPEDRARRASSWSRRGWRHSGARPSIRAARKGDQRARVTGRSFAAAEPRARTRSFDSRSRRPIAARMRSPALARMPKRSGCSVTRTTTPPFLHRLSDPEEDAASILAASRTAFARPQRADGSRTAAARGGTVGCASATSPANIVRRRSGTSSHPFLRTTIGTAVEVFLYSASPEQPAVHRSLRIARRTLRPAGGLATRARRTDARDELDVSSSGRALSVQSPKRCCAIAWLRCRYRIRTIRRPRDARRRWLVHRPVDQPEGNRTRVFGAAVSSPNPATWRSRYRDVSPVAAPRRARGGYPTFGVFQRLAKFNTACGMRSRPCCSQAPNALLLSEQRRGAGSPRQPDGRELRSA